MAADPEPAWLTLFRRRADPKEVAAAWLEGLGPEGQKEAKDDGPTAVRALRRVIVDSQCPEARADAAAGWKYTATVVRAADAVLGIISKKSEFLIKRIAPHGTIPFRPKRVLDNPARLNLWWSDFDTACQARRLVDECGVTHRLNVANEIVSKFSAEDDALLTTIHVPMVDNFDLDAHAGQDGLCSDWAAQLKEVMEILRRLRDEGAVVNVNCQMGKNRSGAVILMWLCSECGWELEAAVLHLRNMVALACGNPHLLAALTQFLGVPDVKVPLNAAADGGGWVCISPPGSPRAGGAAAFDGGFAAGGLEEAASRLGALSSREDTIEGSWDKGTIAGARLVLPGGGHVPLELVSPKEIRMMFNNEAVSAVLHLDGKLHWSDGDVWNRVSKVQDPLLPGPQAGAGYGPGEPPQAAVSETAKEEEGDEPAGDMEALFGDLSDVD